MCVTPQFISARLLQLLRNREIALRKMDTVYLWTLHFNLKCCEQAGSQTHVPRTVSLSLARGESLFFSS